MTRRRGDLRAAVQSLERCLASLGDHGFLIADVRGALPVPDLAVARGTGGPRLAALREAVLGGGSSAVKGAARPVEPAPAAAATAGAATNRDGAASQQETCRPVLEARGLGDSEVRCAGQLVERAHWQSAKSKELFVYLLCHPVWQRRERIEADVWGSATPGQARSGFHINAYRLRRALYQNLLQAQSGKYRLHPDARCWFDAGEFGRRCVALFGQEQAPNFIHQAEAALALYRGPFSGRSLARLGHALPYAARKLVCRGPHPAGPRSRSAWRARSRGALGRAGAGD